MRPFSQRRRRRELRLLPLVCRVMPGLKLRQWLWFQNKTTGARRERRLEVDLKNQWVEAQAALETLPALMQVVQTFIRRAPPCGFARESTVDSDQIVAESDCSRARHCCRIVVLYRRLRNVWPFFSTSRISWVSLPAFPASYGLLSCRNQKPSFIANAFLGRQAVRPWRSLIEC